MKVYALSGDEESQKLILQANIPFVELYKRAIFSYMNDPSDDPYEEDDVTPRNSFYQRRVDEGRVKVIKKYIRDTILNEKNGQSVAVIFPTAMLLAASSTGEKTLKIDDDCEMDEVIYQSDGFYIVDGQHRLFSMKALYDEINNGLFKTDEDKYIIKYLESYRFNCNILLNYDLWEQAQVFADVNFNQKKVSTSLYYSIYGMNYPTNPSDLKRNYLYITHQLVMVLNTHDLSPLKGFVKMLGNGNGFISQAFIADNLMRNIKSPRGIWYVDPYNMKVPPVYRYMTIELLSYFSAVSKVFYKYWPTSGELKSIICKTTGIGALLRLMVYIHQQMLPQKLIVGLRELEKTEIYKEYEDFIIDKLSNLSDIEDRLFSMKGAYSGTGGRGLEVKLFYEMRHKVDCPGLVLVNERSVGVNGKKIDVKIYKSKDGFLTYELSHYFQNPDQMDVYIPGGGSLGRDMEELEYRLKGYLNQVSADAKMVVNRNF